MPSATRLRVTHKTFAWRGIRKSIRIPAQSRKVDSGAQLRMERSFHPVIRDGLADDEARSNPCP